MLLKAFGITKNWQDAEDAVQITAIKMLSIDGVKNNEAFFSTSVFHNSLNTITVRNRRLKNELKYAFDQNSIAPWTEPSNSDPFIRDILVRALATLPKNQLSVMKHMLADEERITHPGHYETVKSHYFFLV